jgi:hypothetical protein
MRFVFLALMCVFAGIHTARSAKPEARPADFWDTAGGLFFSIAASLMYVLAAVASRTGVSHQAYYVLALTGLCLSLASDILIAIREVPRGGNINEVNNTKSESGRNLSIAGFSFSAAAGIAYIGAFYSFAAFSWYDAVFFAVLAALVCALLYNMRRDMFRSIPLLLYTLVICAVPAKALSLLFALGGEYVYAAIAVAWALLLACSGLMRIHKAGGRSDKPYGIIETLIYYCGQALIALSVMI